MKRHRTASQHPAVITRQENCNTPESVALALQRVFYHLQHSSKSVGTKQLTKSFGWDALDAFTQHDVQELDRVLCDNLEEKMKGTPVEKEVPRLFCGKLKNFVKCINVNFSSERTEDFYDLSLNVRGCKNLKESLEKYVEREKLDGDNKYMAEGHGLQDAEKGCTFSSFPPILHLHLKRFEYDPLRDANVKINDRFEFDEEIDLAPYMEEHPGGPEVYLLHSVLVHSGDVNGGHYYAYIRPDCSDRWFKFNDERVTIATRDEARYAAEYPTLLNSLTTTVDGQLAFGLMLFHQSSYGSRELGKDWTGNSTYLWAVAAATYMALMGPAGFAEIGHLILARTRFAAETLAGVPGVKVAGTGGQFRELLLDFSASGRSVAAVNRALLDRHGIFGGIEITPEKALFAFTECHTEADIMALADALREVLS